MSCFFTNKDEKLIWHKKLGHISFKHISKISKLELVRGLPKINFKKDSFCESCQKGK